MKSKTKQELREEIDQLKSQLIDSASVREAMSSAGQYSASPVMVPIRNYSGAFVTVTYTVMGQERALPLHPSGINSTGAIPLERWLELERNSSLVREGYIARTDVPTDNPNVIEDVEGFLKDLSENDIESRIASITNHNVLYKLHDPLASVPRKERSAKILLLLRVLRDRIFELTNVEILDQDPMA